jgi:hypothetical protein
MMNHTSTRFQFMRRTLRQGAIGVASVAASGLLILTPLSAPAVRAAPVAPLSARQMTANDPGTDLRVTLNRLTQEHVYLAGAATGAAISGRDAEFKAAAAELDENSVATAQGIGSVYGPEAEQAFLGLWRAHIGFFADYAMGAAQNDQAMKQQARQNLDGYRMDIDALLTGANPNLPKGAVAELFKPHVEHLTAAIDAQAAGNAPLAYDMLHLAAHQSQEITDPLVDAIIAQFPERFGAMGSAGSASSGMSAGGPTGTAVQQGQRLEGGDITEGLSNDHPVGEEENGDDIE